MVHHQTEGEDPFTVESRFERELQTKEQPYSRTTTVGEKWEEIDCGWLGDNVGMLVIANKEGGFTILPTEEERQELAKKILVLSYHPYPQPPLMEENWWLIPPGESMRGMPSAPKRIYIKSMCGSTKYTISLIPR